jgi:hypothetical protein
MEKDNNNFGQRTARKFTLCHILFQEVQNSLYFLIHTHLLQYFNSTVLVGCKVDVGIPHTAYFNMAPPLHEQGCKLRKQYPLYAVTNNVERGGRQNTQRHLIIKVPAVMFEQLSPRHCSFPLSKLIVSNPIK